MGKIFITIKKEQHEHFLVVKTREQRIISYLPSGCSAVFFVEAYKLLTVIAHHLSCTKQTFHDVKRLVKSGIKFTIIKYRKHKSKLEPEEYRIFKIDIYTIIW